MELIIAIAFFSLASAFCVQFFAKAHMTGQKSAQLSLAGMIAQNTAESFKSMSGQEIERLIEGQDTFVLTEYYNDSGQRLQGEAGSYRIEIQFAAEAQSLYTADIKVYDSAGSHPLYSIKAGNYTAAPYA